MRTTPTNQSAERLPPHSHEAEQGVLGCIMLDPQNSLPMCIDKLRGFEVFYDLRHQTIYQVLLQMWDDQKAIDMITLQQVLKDRNELENIGGMAYLSALADATPSAANLEYYADIVQQRYLKRKVISACTSIVSRTYDDQTAEADEILDHAEREMLKVGAERKTTENRGMRDLVRSALDTIEAMHQRQGKITGLETGFSDFDKMTSGLEGGQMVVIAARPSMGKTSLAMNIAEHVAVDSRIPVGVFSLEMTADSLTVRMLCSRARVNMRNVRDGFLQERDFPKITNASAKLSSAPLFIDDSSGLSILQLRAKARRMAQQHGIKLLVIDYLQLLNSSNRRAENRQQEIADISGGVKGLAKELRIPVIVLSQLNREIEKDKSRKPRLSDLRESGAIEQDADIVGLLYKPNAREDEPVANPDAESVNLFIAKHRNGPVGDINLTFLRPFTRFESAAKVMPEDMGDERSPYRD